MNFLIKLSLALGIVLIMIFIWNISHPQIEKSQDNIDWNYLISK